MSRVGDNFGQDPEFCASCSQWFDSICQWTDRFNSLHERLMKQIKAHPPPPAGIEHTAKINDQQRVIHEPRHADQIPSTCQWCENTYALVQFYEWTACPCLDEAIAIYHEARALDMIPENCLEDWNQKLSADIEIPRLNDDNQDFLTCSARLQMEIALLQSDQGKVWRFLTTNRTLGTHLTHLFSTKQYPEIAEAIIHELTASELSFTLSQLNIRHKFAYGDKYFNPLRDINPSMHFFTPLIEDGFTVLILGAAVPDLLERIHKPASYWKKMRQMRQMRQKMIPSLEPLARCNTIKCWIVCFAPRCKLPDLASMVRSRNETPDHNDVRASSVVMEMIETFWMRQAKHEPDRPVIAGAGTVSAIEPLKFQPSLVGSPFTGDLVQLGGTRLYMEWTREFREETTHMPVLSYVDPITSPSRVQQLIINESLYRSPDFPHVSLEFTVQRPVHDLIAEDVSMQYQLGERSDDVSRFIDDMGFSPETTRSMALQEIRNLGDLYDDEVHMTRCRVDVPLLRSRT